jgi:hypothetical protein
MESFGKDEMILWQRTEMARFLNNDFQFDTYQWGQESGGIDVDDCSS